MRGPPPKQMSTFVFRIDGRGFVWICGLPLCGHDFRRQQQRKPAQCRRRSVSGRMDRCGDVDDVVQESEGRAAQGIPLRNCSACGPPKARIRKIASQLTRPSYRENRASPRVSGQSRQERSQSETCIGSDKGLLRTPQSDIQWTIAGSCGRRLRIGSFRNLSVTMAPIRPVALHLRALREPEMDFPSCPFPTRPRCFRAARANRTFSADTSIP